eukprot:TRINITY_DN4872_c0_g1_i1.p1 TRINITY_DN4872_c0_g1~~TRINITY_DN4872_c0_g1_i1.p1  ORF type:complete len:169 (-),score=10.64 TRINITY_DN4872_c0_g1_i1:37-543(-)
MKNLVRAINQNGTKCRIVLISSLGVERPTYFICLLLNTMLSMVLKYKLQAENVLRTSGIPYTIVRPGGLEAKEDLKIVIAQHDKISGMISRANVARLCEVIYSTNLGENCTLECVAKKHNDEENLSEQLKTLETDKGVIPDPGHTRVIGTIGCTILGVVGYAIYHFCF